ncbi:MAG: hypothetical protein J6S74_00720 [Alphaproteobacteria bacterium]|nr:hypothetical protein [Alphaproteobacteria bacterium]
MRNGQAIDNTGFITNAGITVGKEYDSNRFWYAKWTSVCGTHQIYQNGNCVCNSGYEMVYDDDVGYCVQQ